MDGLGTRIVGGIVGCLLGCMTVLVFFLLIQVSMGAFDVDRARVPVPLLLLALPFIASAYGVKRGPSIVATARTHLGGAGPNARLVLLGPVFWAVVVLAYTLVFEPFGYTMNNHDWVSVAKVILFPVAVLWGGIWAVRRFVFQN